MSSNNIGYICTHLQCENGLADKTAFRFVDSDLNGTNYSFAQLDAASNQFANALKEINIRPEDRIFIFLPKQPEVFFSFLGTLKTKAVAGVLFSNFGKEAVFDRLADAQAKILITKQSLFKRIEEIWPDLPGLEKVILTDLPAHKSNRVLSYTQLVEHQSTEFLVPDTAPETPSVLHYTSGSTGKPKGVLHVHNSIHHQRMTMEKVMQIEPTDIYWCTADHAWVTGTTYGIIGPWSKGLTQVHFGGKFDTEAWFDLLKQEKITLWYTAPTALRMLMREEDKIAEKYDLPALKRVYSVGEPLNPEIVHWVRRVIKKEIYDTWFQTETGGIMITNRPGLPVKPGSMGKPINGVEAGVFTEDGKSSPLNESSSLRLKKGWSSMFRTYINMEDAYRSKFHGDFYDTGDLAQMDEDGYFWFIGRNDDVFNTSGHLVGPFEVESALLEMEDIVDVAVIGAPDEMLYEKVIAFVTLKNHQEWTRRLEVKARIHITKRISPIAVPSEFIVTPKIPKNRSGKIMRRVLKARYLGEDAGDISTLED